MRSIALATCVVACSRAPQPQASVSPPSPSATVDAVDASPVALAHPERAFALPPAPECADLRCRLTKAYAEDAKAQALALLLFDETGDVAGTEHELTMDGGFRGTLHITSALPTGDERPALERVLAATRDFESFFKQLYPTPPSTYRWRDLTLRFFRSSSGPAGHEVSRSTPSAYAIGPRRAPSSAADEISFSLAYNVGGSLVGTDVGARETMFHEIFHMNDAEHGDWSPRVLSTDYDAIVRKCGAMNITCLRPYAPNDTMVRGGTYYAFEPNNGLPVREYAAELALRWYKEQRAILQGGHLAAFKCGPPENRRAWEAMVHEFFGVDRVPECSK